MTTSRGITDTQDLRPRGRDRALRHPAGADPRLHRPQGRHLGQHPRRPGHRRQDRRPAAPAVRRPRGVLAQHRRDLRREAQAEPERARRPRARLEGARDRCIRDIAAWTSTSRRARRAGARPLASCARCSATSSCATRCAGSRRRLRPRSGAAPPRDETTIEAERRADRSGRRSTAGSTPSAASPRRWPPSATTARCAAPAYAGDEVLAGERRDAGRAADRAGATAR